MARLALSESSEELYPVDEPDKVVLRDMQANARVNEKEGSAALV